MQSERAIRESYLGDSKLLRAARTVQRAYQVARLLIELRGLASWPDGRSGPARHRPTPRARGVRGLPGRA